MGKGVIHKERIIALMNDKSFECDHRFKTDLAPFTAAKQAGESHYYCHGCGAHWWKDKFYTKKEWADWIEVSNEEVWKDF